MFKKLKNIRCVISSFLFPVFPSRGKDYKTYKQKVNHISLNFAKVGQGPALIFIHGWTNDWEGWIPNIKYLDKSYTLYLADLPGFGDSGDLPHYSIASASDYLSKLITRLSITPEAVVGVSMGSFIAADLALRYPELVKSAILTGPVIKDGRNRIFPETLGIILKTVRKSKLSEKALKRMVETRAVAYFAAKYMNMYKFKKDIIDAYGMVGKKKVRKEAYIDMGISAAEYDFKDTLSKISIPTLLMIGEKDKYTCHKYVAREIIPLNKNLTLIPIPHAGHVVPWDRPKETADIIKEFLRFSASKSPLYKFQFK